MEKSCGAVLFTRIHNEIRYLLVRSLEGKYGFPKGHMEGLETETETALREIREETGIRPELMDGFRETISYTLPKTGVRKQVVFFLGSYQDQVPKYQAEELLSCIEVPYGQALALLSHRDSVEILEKAEGFLRGSASVL